MCRTLDRPPRLCLHGPGAVSKELEQHHDAWAAHFQNHQQSFEDVAGGERVFRKLEKPKRNLRKEGGNWTNAKYAKSGRPSC